MKTTFIRTLLWLWLVPSASFAETIIVEASRIPEAENIAGMAVPNVQYIRSPDQLEDTSSQQAAVTGPTSGDVCGTPYAGTRGTSPQSQRQAAADYFQSQMNYAFRVLMALVGAPFVISYSQGYQVFTPSVVGPATLGMLVEDTNTPPRCG